MIPYEIKERYTLDDLVEIVSLLRCEDGCPWDKEQTHSSIRMDLIEETYEVIDAIDQDDPEMLREELGDLLLQVVFHTQIERESDRFTMEDVCTDICQKLITRHPHVFSTVQADTTEEVLKNWDAIKEKSKNQTTRTETLRAVPKTLPALMRAQKTFKRAAKENPHFWNHLASMMIMKECWQELERAICFSEKEKMEQALGNLMFCCAGLCHLLDLQAEQALTDTTERFVRMFAYAEETNNSLADISQEDWTTLWKRFQTEKEA